MNDANLLIEKKGDEGGCCSNDPNGGGSHDRGPFFVHHLEPRGALRSTYGLILNDFFGNMQNP